MTTEEEKQYTEDMQALDEIKECKDRILSYYETLMALKEFKDQTDLVYAKAVDDINIEIDALNREVKVLKNG